MSCSYMIAPRMLDEENSILGTGSIDSITYSLDGAPSSWFINSATGVITGRFTTVGLYDFSILAIDAGGLTTVLERFEIRADNPPQFKSAEPTPHANPDLSSCSKRFRSPFMSRLAPSR